MEHGVGWILLAHIGVPLLFGLAFVVFSLAASKGPRGWDLAIETALDLAILSIGATGALFENPKLIAAFGVENTIVGIAVIGINLLLSSILVWLRRATSDGSNSPGPGIGFLALFIGSLTIAVVVSVVTWGYRSGQTPNQQSGKISTLEVRDGILQIPGFDRG